MSQEVNENKIYVVGHKNPDTDSICSAIAYAALKKELTGKDYVARRAGRLNEETQYVLEYFGVEDTMTPPDINEENEVAFKVYYRCVDGNTETSIGSEIYAYNVKTDTIRDLGSAN